MFERLSAWFDLFRELRSAFPTMRSAILADRHYRRGARQAQRGRRDAAIQSLRISAEIYRSLVATDRSAFLTGLTITLSNMCGILIEAGDADGLPMAREAVALARELHARQGDDARELLAGSLLNLAVALRHPLQLGEAADNAGEAVAIFRTLFAEDSNEYRQGLALALNALSMSCREAGRRAEAVAAAKESVVHGRGVIEREGRGFQPVRSLAASLNNLGLALQVTQARADALLAMQEACEQFDSIEGPGRIAIQPVLALGLSNLGVCCSDLGRRDDAVNVTRRAVDILGELANRNQALLPDYAGSLGNLAMRFSEAGRRADALACAEFVVQCWRHLVAQDRSRYLFRLATALGNAGLCLHALGRLEEALVNAKEAVALMRGAREDGNPDVTPYLAGMIGNLGLRFAESGQYEQALECAWEDYRLCRELVAADRTTHLPALVRGLDNLGALLRTVERTAESLPLIEEAVRLTAELVAGNRAAYLPLHASSLTNLGIAHLSVDNHDDALTYAFDAAVAYRELVDGHRAGHLPQLAMSLNNLGIAYAEAGRKEQALETSRETVAIYRELAAPHRASFLSELGSAVQNLSHRHAELDQEDDARALLRECSQLLLEAPPQDPIRWSHQALEPTLFLDSADDLLAWHIPLLRKLTEYRELAHGQEQVEAFLQLQSQAALQLWEALGGLGPEHGELVDDAVATLVSTLQSPDLARWLDARGSEDGALDALADLKRQVIEADQALGELRKRLPGSGGMRGADASTPQPLDDPSAAIEAQAHRATALRQQFRDERARLAREDARFAAAFDPPDAHALRAFAGHAGAGAMLCLLELDDDGERRAVGALLHAGDRRTRLLELPGLFEVATAAAHGQPRDAAVGRGAGAHAVAMRGAAADVSPGATRLPSPDADDLAARLERSLWAPLRQALEPSSTPGSRLHLCTHGMTQQLPLALRSDEDDASPLIVAWPGLPYLRAAATAVEAARPAAAPWLVGHDCAWDGDRPLPMVAVEAALLRQLLAQRGFAVQEVGRADEVHVDAAALVACCHGGAEQAQFDHALHLGAEPLTVRRIVQKRLGPPLALLPACHAGRTDEDTAGNALGVAAAFMLSGTRVVSASSKAVPDLLQPWLSTLTVWHVAQGLPHHEAALLARHQFAGLTFPDDYRHWLCMALPQALATIQPGGAEARGTRSAPARRALQDVALYWPWQGETRHLFSEDADLRAEATRSVALGILQPRGDAEDARGLAAAMREMAAFVVVYGIDAAASTALGAAKYGLASNRPRSSGSVR